MGNIFTIAASFVKKAVNPLNSGGIKTLPNKSQTEIKELLKLKPQQNTDTFVRSEAEPPLSYIVKEIKNIKDPKSKEFDEKMSEFFKKFSNGHFKDYIPKNNVTPLQTDFNGLKQARNYAKNRVDH